MFSHFSDAVPDEELQSPRLYVSYQSLLQTEIALQDPILPGFVIALSNYFELKILSKAWF